MIVSYERGAYCVVYGVWSAVCIVYRTVCGVHVNVEYSVKQHVKNRVNY
jgi:hypothetical protein